MVQCKSVDVSGQVREGLGNGNLECALFGERGERCSPTCRRGLQRSRNRMRVPPREGPAEAFDHARGVERAGAYQQNQIDSVPDAAVWRGRPRQRVGVELLRELLLALDHRHVGWRDSGETEPITRPQELHWLDDDVTDSDIQVELHKGAAAEQRFHGMPGTSARGAIEIHHGFSNPEGEEVAGVQRSNILQVLEYGGGLCPHGEIKVFSGACCVETQFHRVPALQNPVGLPMLEKPGQSAVERNLPAQALQVHCFFLPGRFAFSVLPALSAVRRPNCTVELSSSMAPFQRIDDLRKGGIFSGPNQLPHGQFALTPGVPEGFPKRGFGQ